MVERGDQVAIGWAQWALGEGFLDVAKPEAANNPADRERDAERTNNQSDGSATIAGRNPKGEGRSSQ